MYRTVHFASSRGTSPLYEFPFRVNKVLQSILGPEAGYSEVYMVFLSPKGHNRTLFCLRTPRLRQYHSHLIVDSNPRFLRKQYQGC